MEPWELVRYLGYEALFVVGPGWLVLRALAPGIRSRAWQLALGWPIGLTLEILAFSFTAAIGARGLFLAYPVLVGLAAVAVIRRRGSVPRSDLRGEDLFSRPERLTLAGLCLLAFCFIGVGYFAPLPLPGHVPDAFYPGDPEFHIAVAASALHGWPPANYLVSGEPFNYHFFVHLHMAGASQVTGIDLPVVVLRLYLLPLTAILVLQLALAGRLVGGVRWAGAVTVALFLLVRGLDLSVDDITPFGDTDVYRLWSSPSQLLGMVMFIAVLSVLWMLLDPDLRARAGGFLEETPRRLWVVLGLLLIGAGGAKSVILPALIGALCLYMAWTRLREKRVDRTALAALGLCAALFVVFYFVMYRGGSLGLRIDPPATIKQMPPLARVHDAWPSGALADGAFWALAVPAGLLMYFAAPLLGVALWLRQVRSPSPSGILSISLLAVGVGAFLFVSDEYLEQTYITAYGLIAVMPFAALGLIRFFEPTFRQIDRGWIRPVGLAAAWVAAAVLLAYVAHRIWGHGHYLRADLVSYLPVVAAIGALALLAALAGARRRGLLAALAAGALLLTASMDAPLDLFPNPASRLVEGKPPYQASRAALRPRELRAMEWIRDHLPARAILAVSNDRTPHTRDFGPSDATFPAFTEHRTFREAWGYTARANEIGEIDVFAGRKDPFPQRTALERAAYARADPAAVRTMADRYGVTHIVVDKKNGAVNPRLYRLGNLVYSNGAVDVIELSDLTPVR